MSSTTPIDGPTTRRSLNRMPVNLDNIRRELTEEDARLQAMFDNAPQLMTGQPLIIECLIAIHKRQGDAIMLGLQTR